MYTKAPVQFEIHRRDDDPGRPVLTSAQPASPSKAPDLSTSKGIVSEVAVSERALGIEPAFNWSTVLENLRLNLGSTWAYRDSRGSVHLCAFDRPERMMPSRAHEPNTWVLKVGKRRMVHFAAEMLEAAANLEAVLNYQFEQLVRAVERGD